MPRRHAPFPTTSFAILIACCGLVGWMVSSATGQDRAGSGTVRLTQCRIRLIDEAVLAAERSGIVHLVAVSEGDEVRSDEVVATLRDDALRATFAVVENEAKNDVEVRYARKASDMSSAEYVRSLQANKEVPGTYPELEIRRLRMAAEKALLQIEQAEHQLFISELKRDETGTMLKAFRVSAPFDGVVTKVLKRRGEAVREGEPILEIASTRRMRVEGFLDVKDSYRVVRDSVVEVQLEIPGVDLDVERMTFPGRVEFVDIKVQPVTQKVRIWAEVANQDNALKDGLTATVIIDPSQRRVSPFAEKPGRTLNR